MKIRTKNRIIYGILIVVVLFIGVCSFAGCANENAENKKPPYVVDLELYNAEVGTLNRQEKQHSIKLTYDGNPKVFDIKAYSPSLKRYLTDGDVRVNLDYFIKVIINYPNQSGYIVIDKDDLNAWPKERGYYDIYVSFNEIPYGEHDINYFLDKVNILLQIL